jgi:hypothetical protein
MSDKFNKKKKKNKNKNKTNNNNNINNTNNNNQQNNNINESELLINLFNEEFMKIEMIPQFNLDLPALNISNDPRSAAICQKQHSVIYNKDYKLSEEVIIYYHFIQNFIIEIPHNEKLSLFEIIYVPKNITYNEIHVLFPTFIEPIINFINDIQEFNVKTLDLLKKERSFKEDLFPLYMNQKYNDMKIEQYDDQQNVIINSNFKNPLVLINPYNNNNNDLVSCVTVLCDNVSNAKSCILKGEYALIVNTVLIYYLEKFNIKSLINKRQQNREFNIDYEF